jgi:hypothetical protein
MVTLILYSVIIIILYEVTLYHVTYVALHCTALHCTALHCTEFHFIALQSNAKAHHNFATSLEHTDPAQDIHFAAAVKYHPKVKVKVRVVVVVVQGGKNRIE